MNWNAVIDVVDVRCGKMGFGGLYGSVYESLGGLGYCSLGLGIARVIESVAVNVVSYSVDLRFFG